MATDVAIDRATDGATSAGSVSVAVPTRPRRRRRSPVPRATVRLIAGATAVYVASRLALLVTVYACTVVATSLRLGDLAVGPWPDVPAVHNRGLALLGRWDSSWYDDIALHGYGPRDVPAAATDGRQAFFPAWPLTLRWVGHLTGVSIATAGPWLDVAFGLVGAVVVAVHAAGLFDDAAGLRAAALFSFFPGSFVLLMAYSEGLMIAATAGCLLALHRRAWWLAGICAAIATATRPTALALVPACLLAALLAVRGRREWAALVAPLLAPLGAIAWFGWLAGGGGSFTRWFGVERTVWREHLSVTVVATRVRDAVDQPLGYLNALGPAVGGVVLLVALVVVLRSSLPAADRLYAVLVTLSFEFSYSIGARPRMLLVVVPAFVAVAGRVRGRGWTPLIAVAAALLPVTAALSWLTLLQTP